MLQFFVGLPWYVRTALVGGGSLITGFSSKLPDALQEVGLLFGLALASLGIIAFIWHWLNDRRIKSGKERIALDPSALLPAFAVIALVGVLGVMGCIGWSYFRTPKNTLAVYATPSVSAPSQQQAAPDLTLPPPAPTKEAGRFYSTGDKERISEAFYKLSDTLNKPITKIEQDSQGLIRYWDGVKGDPSRNQELKNIISQLGGLNSLSAQAYTELVGIARDYHKYWDILSEIMQDPPVENDRPLVAWQLARNEFYRALTTYDGLQMSVPPRTLEGLWLMVDPTKEKFRDKTAALNEWIRQCNNRIRVREAAILK